MTTNTQESRRLRDRRARGLLRRHLPAGDPPSADGAGRRGRASSSSSWRTSTASASRSPSPTSTATRARSRWSSRRSARPRARCSRPARSAPRSTRVVGPMGIPSHIGKAKKVVCVGGGLGVAPIFPQARAFKESGAYVIGVLGFRNKDLMFWEDKFRAVCDELILCTDDGSAGIKGLGHRGHQAGDREAPRHRRVRRHRPAGDDEGLRRGDAAAQDQDHGEPQPGDGRRHRHVRRLPRQGRRAGEVRLRRRPRLRRPPGRFRRPDGPAAALQAGRRRRRSSAGRRAAACAAQVDGSVSEPPP